VSASKGKSSRLTLISSKSFEAVIAALESAIGRPNMSALRNELDAAKTFEEMERVIRNAEGPSGFIEFLRLDLGAILRMESRTESPKSMRFLIGNPLIMKEMLKHVPDAGSYAPVTILVDERTDGVHLSYDTMAGYLAPYGNLKALQVAEKLDRKVENLLTQTA
jgi:uncharacterized protein (DUF302 family)